MNAISRYSLAAIPIMTALLSSSITWASNVALTQMQKVAAGQNHTCAVGNASSLQCWGDNTSGQLGNGTFDTTAIATTVLDTTGQSALTNVIMTASGLRNTCALITGGTVQCWGNNSYAQLAQDPASIEAIGGSSTPVPIVGLTGVTTIAMGQDTACALINGGPSGTVKCWGFNGNGETGQVPGSPSNPDDYLTTPTLVAGTGDGTNGVAAIAMGNYNVCVLLNNVGTVRCWGANNYGQLGVDPSFTSSGYSATPLQIQGVTGATGIAVGYSTSCAVIGSNGTVQCWGLGNAGQLAVDPTTLSTCGSGACSTAPITIQEHGVDITGFTTVALGRKHVCATLQSGAVKCWGIDTDSQLGIAPANLDPLRVPTQCGSSVCSVTPLTVAGLSATSAVTTGQYYSCTLETSNGAIKCWGANGVYVLLGNGVSNGPDVATPGAVLQDGVHTNIGLMSSSNPSAYGQVINLTATVTNDSSTPLTQGTVLFQQGEGPTLAAISGCTEKSLVTGTASCAVTLTTLGALKFNAQYSGFGSYQNSITSSSLTQTVNKATTTITLSTSLSPTLQGSAVTLTAVIGNGSPTPVNAPITGNITFNDAGTAITACANATVSINNQTQYQATCTINSLSTGDHNIRAIYNGDTNNFSSALSNTVVQSIVVAGPASTVAVLSGGTPQSAPVNTIFTPLTVQLTDGAFPVQGITLFFRAPPSTGPSALLSLTDGVTGTRTQIVATTDSNGTATVYPTANTQVGGAYTVIATTCGSNASSLLDDEIFCTDVDLAPITFSLTNQ